jgi:hypothetical protein
MQKPLLLILFCLLFSFACDEKEDPVTACGVSDPLENLAWLKQMAENAAIGGLSEFSYITQAKYKGKRVFYQGSCCPNCSWALILYDLEDSEVIWQPDGSQCDFG